MITGLAIKGLDVVLDRLVRMPGMSGFDLHDRLVATGHSIPTIFLTAFPDEKGNDRAAKAQAVAYLSKEERAITACAPVA
jgi:FixJ family two-component response regulator